MKTSPNEVTKRRGVCSMLKPKALPVDAERDGRRLANDPSQDVMAPVAGTARRQLSVLVTELHGSDTFFLQQRCAAIERAATELVAQVGRLVAEASPNASRAHIPRKAVSVDDAAAMLGVGRSTMYELLETGGVRSVKVGRRRLVPIAALDDFLTMKDTGAS
jgi:excisionase family DNA binding protein